MTIEERVDKLENVLAALATCGEGREAITVQDLKRALQHEGVIE